MSRQRARQTKFKLRFFGIWNQFHLNAASTSAEIRNQSHGKSRGHSTNNRSILIEKYFKSIIHRISIHQKSQRLKDREIGSLYSELWLLLTCSVIHAMSISIKGKSSTCGEKLPRVNPTWV